jgi:hypothetical protein
MEERNLSVKHGNELVDSESICLHRVREQFIDGFDVVHGEWLR